MMPIRLDAVLLGLASLASAQFGPGGQYRPGRSGGSNSPFNSDGDGDYSFGNRQFGGFNSASFLSSRNEALIAHGVMASLAFVLLFPMGAIMVRMASFRGLWLVHGIFQVFAYLVYTAAFGVGIWIVTTAPVNLMGHSHPVIGIVVFCLLVLQPILGTVHHLQYKKHQRRTIWSYGHIWLGRIAVTLGIINGGLGLLFASETGYFAPGRGQVAAYGLVAGIMWVLWVAAIVVGERRKKARARTAVAGQSFKDQYT